MEELPFAPANSQEQIVAEIKARAAADEQAATSQVVQARELHDANPWLQMTRWARYLAKDKVHYQDLLDVVTTPDPEPEDPTSRATRVVWDTMEQLARRSQHTVKHCGNGIWMAAVSTTPNQTPFQLLRAYMDEKSIQDHVRPWQQILLFIIHTQMDWPWRQGKPGYDPRSSPDPMAIDNRLDPARIQPFIMTPMETACLEFCIELLNQKIKVHEYESPLVCAMAVLGRGEKAWQDPNSYPPIISQVLKVACFMIVQKALWLDLQCMEIICMWATTTKQGDEGFAKGVETIPLLPPSSPPSSRHGMPIGRIPRTPRMPFQAGVDWMVQKFMVRGQHGPVEVLLDWRTFGLKISYNTTTPGHVTWMGQERLLYKEMNFTMGEFRGFMHGLNWLVDYIAREPAVARAFTTQGEVSCTKVQKYFQQVA
ncbi:hypothetical protein BDV19DRAFT_383212 [Aspergillus venezuelensis]